MEQAPDNRVEFSADLYSPVAIERAVAAYGALGRLTVEHGAASVTVTIAEADPDVADVLADELANFALNETIRLHRAPTATFG